MTTQLHITQVTLIGENDNLYNNGQKLEQSWLTHSTDHGYLLADQLNVNNYKRSFVRPFEIYRFMLINHPILQIIKQFVDPLHVGYILSWDIKGEVAVAIPANRFVGMHHIGEGFDLMAATYDNELGESSSVDYAMEFIEHDTLGFSKDSATPHKFVINPNDSISEQLAETTINEAYGNTKQATTIANGSQWPIAMPVRSGVPDKLDDKMPIYNVGTKTWSLEGKVKWLTQAIERYREHCIPIMARLAGYNLTAIPVKRHFFSILHFTRAVPNGTQVDAQNIFSTASRVVGAIAGATPYISGMIGDKSEHALISYGDLVAGGALFMGFKVHRNFSYLAFSYEKNNLEARFKKVGTPIHVGALGTTEVGAQTILPVFTTEWISLGDIQTSKLISTGNKIHGEANNGLLLSNPLIKAIKDSVKAGYTKSKFELIVTDIQTGICKQVEITGFRDNSSDTATEFEITINGPTAVNDGAYVTVSLIDTSSTIVGQIETVSNFVINPVAVTTSTAIMETQGIPIIMRRVGLKLYEFLQSIKRMKDFVNAPDGKFISVVGDIETINFEAGTAMLTSNRTVKYTADALTLDLMRRKQLGMSAYIADIRNEFRATLRG